jgi:hypothetical protein
MDSAYLFAIFNLVLNKLMETLPVLFFPSVIPKVQTGEIMHKLTGHTDKITALRLTVRGQLIISGKFNPFNVDIPSCDALT